MVDGPQPALANAGAVHGTLPSVSPDEPAIVYSDPAKGGDGSFSVDGKKDLAQFRWRAAQLNQGGVNIALPGPAGGNPGQQVNPSIDLGAQDGIRGDSEIAYFFGRETSGNFRFGVKPQIGPPINMYLSNVFISSELVFGTSQLPGYLASPLYAWLNSEIDLNAISLASSPGALTAQMGAFCRAWNDSKEQRDARRAAHDGCYIPLWSGPEMKMNPALTGPEITIAPGATVRLRFPAPYDFDFLAAWILDDSTSTTGLEPQLNAIPRDERSRDNLVDDPAGISWRDFIACPCVNVAGMPNGGNIRAMSLKSPKGGITHRIPAGSALEVDLVSSDAGTITARVALHGWSVQCGAAPKGGQR